MKKKQRFEVKDDESIDECLQRMQQLGYQPIKRMEKPVFTEVKGKDPVWKKQQIMFEGILIESQQEKS